MGGRAGAQTNATTTAITPTTPIHHYHPPGITKEEMAQPAFQGLAALNFPELHEESIPELNFFRACHKMMTVRACVCAGVDCLVGNVMWVGGQGAFA